MRRVYLDHNAGSPLRPEARREVAEALAASTGNPSSLHFEGRLAREIVEHARERVAAAAAVAARDLVFTSGGSESIAFAVAGACRRAPRERRRLVVSSIEHSAVLESARSFEAGGFVVDRVACGEDGLVSPDAFRARLGADVALAALQAANPETGVVQPWEEVAAACRERGIPFLLDAVQAAGKTIWRPRSLEGILVALAAHKLGGPQGAGALVVPEGVRLAPLVPGGAQERRRRAGTEAVALLAGFGAAAEAAGRSVAEEAGRLGALRDRFERGLRATIDGVLIHGEGSPRLPNTTLFSVPDVEGDTLAIALDLAGFAVSTGSACASGAIEPSHVLLAMGRSPRQARAGVRVSTGWSTVEEDVARLERALPEIVTRARRAAS